MRLVSDRSRLFTVVILGSWLALIAVPFILSIVFNNALGGAPLLGVLLWFVLLRSARLLSPATRADQRLRNGQPEKALEICDRALAVQGAAAWTETRRLVWLNRRTVALLALGKPDAALQAALDALDVSHDPETLGALALALLRLNRFDEAGRAAKIAVDVTRERSVIGHTVLAAVKLRRGLPAEAEAMARAGLMDMQSLMPLVHPEHHALCLSILCRAERMLGQAAATTVHMEALQSVARRNPGLRALALVEEIETLPDTPDMRDLSFRLLEDASDAAPDYVLWYVTQPATFPVLRGDARLLPYLDHATQEFQRLATSAPSADIVQQTLDVAAKDAMPSPSPQASRGALLVQLLTLAGTLLLLLGWTWRFFIAGA